MDPRRRNAVLRTANQADRAINSEIRDPGEMRAFFTGFDSAWSPLNSGAICDLLLEDDSLRLVGDPIPASWGAAVVRAEREDKADLQVWSIDQPLVVHNKDGCRPVERRLASALMADFGCGAHSSNLGLPAWAEDAPIWSFIRALESKGYQHNPMAIPGAKAGQFYIECYPHPAILGLFDLGRILKYKVHHRNLEDWQELIRLLRSLACAELPICNICSFVEDGLPQNKKNEDRLDSIVSAYVAAYWWKFGIHRSAVVGDLSTGYIVTPHSERTFAALTRVFGVQINPPGAARALPRELLRLERSEAAGVHGQSRPRLETLEMADTLPRCDWVYFATPAKWSGTVTRDFVAEQTVIVRSVHNAAGQRTSNVQHLRPGERILLVHGGHGKPYRALFSCTICAAREPVRTSQCVFDVFSYLDESLHEQLRMGGYTPDPVVRRFTGISISEVQDLRGITSVIPRRLGNNTISRWEEVFGP